MIGIEDQAAAEANEPAWQMQQLMLPPHAGAPAPASAESSKNKQATLPRTDSAIGRQQLRAVAKQQRWQRAHALELRLVGAQMEDMGGDEEAEENEKETKEREGKAAEEAAGTEGTEAAEGEGGSGTEDPASLSTTAVAKAMAVVVAMATVMSMAKG